MTDAQIEKVLAEGCPIAAVLLSRGGWLRSEEVAIVKAFEADRDSPAVWRVELRVNGEDKSWHDVFVEAASIVGVSVDRSRTPLDDQSIPGAV
jgi:hypothetical protein